MVGEVAEDWGLGVELAGVVMEIVHLHVGVGVDEVDTTVEDCGEEHRACLVYAVGLLRYLLGREPTHLLHLDKIVGKRGVLSHKVGGKAILLPGKSVHVLSRTFIVGLTT